MIQKISSIVVFTAMTCVSRSFAADRSVCVDQFKQVCAGLENSMETCLSDRGDKLTDTCRDLLKAAISMAQSNTGAASCLNDVKQYCPDLDGEKLAHCILNNKSSFSKACSDYIDSAAPAAASSDTK